MMSPNKTRTSIRPAADRRYSARYLILIYRGTPAHFDPLEIQRLVGREQAKCTIVRESRNENVSSYFAFVDFAGKRFQTRNLGLFDIQGYHPKWIHVTSSPWRMLDEMKSKGDVLWNGIIRPNKQTSSGRKTSATSKTSSSSSPWELVGSATNEASFQELLRKETTIEKSEPAEPLLDDFEAGAISGVGETEMARNVQYWQDGYRAGYKAAISKSNLHQTSSNSSRNSDLPQCDDDLAHLIPSNYGADLESSASNFCTQSNLFTEADNNIQTDLSQLDWDFEPDVLGDGRWV